mmetsp:Transcript_10388/g.25332  ORF Transcript_10388/g.25332 Transcript_10388/m.25332 type:complete len:229 (+) Transcript_10388:610-1296(+)
MSRWRLCRSLWRKLIPLHSCRMITATTSSLGTWHAASWWSSDPPSISSIARCTNGGCQKASKNWTTFGHTFSAATRIFSSVIIWSHLLLSVTLMLFTAIIFFVGTCRARRTIPDAPPPMGVSSICKSLIARSETRPAPAGVAAMPVDLTRKSSLLKVPDAVTSKNFFSVVSTPSDVPASPTDSIGGPPFRGIFAHPRIHRLPAAASAPSLLLQMLPSGFPSSQPSARP